MSTQDTITAVLLRKDRVEWTSARYRKSGVEVVDRNTADLEITEQDNTADRTSQIKAAIGSGKGEITAILHTDQVLLRIVDLPAADLDELQGMVELQVDKFSPFPIEHMAVSFEVLGTTDTDSRVLIAACKRDAVQHLGDLFLELGRLPDRIDVAIAGWWHLIESAGGIEPSGRHGLILLDETGAELIITQDGLPVLLRSLGSQAGASDEEYYAELAEEAGYTLTSLESEWGAHATPDLTVWHSGPEPEALLQVLQSECEVAVHSRQLDNIPALSEGVVLRTGSGEDEMPRLDLCLPEWKEEAAARAGQRRLLTFVTSLLLIWFLLVAGFLTYANVDRTRMERLRIAVAGLEEPAEAASALSRRVASLEQYADRTHSALEVLREITVLLPDGVELNSFTFRKAGTVNLRGESRRAPAIYDFLDAMQGSELFREVTLEGVTQAPGGRRNPEFRMTVHLPGGDPE